MHVRKLNMHAKDLFQLIPENELKALAIDTQVDHHAKKLDGLVMFQLILFSFLKVVYII